MVWREECVSEQILVRIFAMQFSNMTLESYLNFSVFVKWTIKYRVEDLNLIMDIRYLTHYKFSHGTLYLCLS